MAIVISHRFSTVRMADDIIVLHRGHITEHGSHDDLIAADQEYAKLFEMQAKGYQ
jgi:ATP-binding cassette subfamily B protein